MTRTHVRRRRTILAGALALAGAIAWGSFGRSVAASPARSVAEHRYVVRTGDTLWSIAERVAPGMDPRAVVDSIAMRNGVDAGSLVPGRSLVVPGGA